VREQVLQVLHAGGAGATLAEVPVFDGTGYVASAFAMEPCRIMMIPRAARRDRSTGSARCRPTTAHPDCWYATLIG
jgi:CRP-like cAMP-binding protein